MHVRVQKVMNKGEVRGGEREQVPSSLRQTLVTLSAWMPLMKLRKRPGKRCPRTEGEAL